MDDRHGLTEKVIFEQKLEEGERASNMNIRGKSESHKWNSECRGVEAGECLPCLKKSWEASVAGIEGMGEEIRDEPGEVMGPNDVDPDGHDKDFGFNSECDKESLEGLCRW